MLCMLYYDILVSKFEPLLCYYVHILTNNSWEKFETLNPLLAIKEIVPLLFYKNGFGID